MENKEIKSGVVHKVPEDLRKSLTFAKLINTWNSLTPLARNEWICWVISPVKEETRERRIRIANDKLKKGERRPCCWVGCIHR